MASKPHIDRRQFVTIVTVFLGTVMGALIGIPAIFYLLAPALKREKSEAWIALGVIDDFPIGKPTMVNFTRTKVNGWEKTVNSYGVYVYRKSASDIIVFSNLCTHLSCRVTWKEAQGEYICPCHDGHFDINGEVTAGPPPRALDQYVTKIEDGSLFIFLQEV